MRSFILLCFLLSAASTIASASARNASYAGAINKTLNIHMKLSFQDGVITGSYFYDKNKVAIPLKGTLRPDGSFEMRELDANGTITGVFTGVDSSLLELEGNWSKPDGAKKLPFTLKTDPVFDGGKSTGWAGAWDYEKNTEFDATSIEIANETARGFDFGLDAQSGANTGQLEGTAAITGNRADWTDAETGCKVTLTLKDHSLFLETTEGCQQFCGAGVQFLNGRFAQGSQTQVSSLVTLGILATSAQEDAFRKLTGSDYSLFVDSFQLISEVKDLDGLGARGFSGGVRGLFTEMEAIVLYREDGKFWAAAIDSGEESVKYFTNDPGWSGKLPKSIDEWRENFRDKKVVYMNAAK